MTTSLHRISADDMALIARHDPAAYEQIRLRLEWEEEQEEKERCENSLLEFFMRAWQEIDSAPLSVNWHHHRIIERLEDMAFGIIRDLIINIPPRHSKSQLCNVIYPAWIWIQKPDREYPLIGPQVKFLCVSHTTRFAERLGLAMLRLVESEWYQKHWGDRVRLRQDQSSRGDFANHAGGTRVSNSIEGGIQGHGADIRIADDPLSRRAADSEAERASALQGMSDLTTRITDPRTAAQLLIMQRLNNLDPTDWALKNWPKDTVHLMYPARYDSRRHCMGDPRTRDGELLWPEVWNEEELFKIERGLAALDGEILSDYSFSAQFQQLPIERGGGIVTADDWQIWPEWTPRAEDMTILPSGEAYVSPPPVSHVVLSLDTALSEKETADWNACVVIGVWHRPRNLVQIVGAPEQIDDGEQPRAIVMGGWRRRCKLNDETRGRDGRPLGLVRPAPIDPPG